MTDATGWVMGRGFQELRGAGALHEARRRKGTGFSVRDSRKNRPCRRLDFRPVGLILAFWSTEA